MMYFVASRDLVVRPAPRELSTWTTSNRLRHLSGSVTRGGGPAANMPKRGASDAADSDDPSPVPPPVASRVSTGRLELDGVSIRADVEKDLECHICAEVFVDPVTTPCGHTFCAACLRRSVDHNTRCPMCRTILLLSAVDQLPVNVTLAQLAARLLPEETAARARSVAAAEQDLHAPEGKLALFLMSVVLPDERVSLNIFEPRYRLLVRRAMEGSRRFGMAGVHAAEDGSRAPYRSGCEVEIEMCEPLPDGRFHITVVGRRRFRIVDDLEAQDGYALARVQYVDDLDDADAASYLSRPPEGDEPTGEPSAELWRVDPVAAARAAFHELHTGFLYSCDVPSTLASAAEAASRAATSLGEAATALTAAARAAGDPRSEMFADLTARWEEKMTRKPEAPSEGEAWAQGRAATLSWWLADALPVADSDKELLLRASSARERLIIEESLAASVTMKLVAIAAQISREEEGGDAEDID